MVMIFSIPSMMGSIIFQLQTLFFPREREYRKTRILFNIKVL